MKLTEVNTFKRGDGVLVDIEEITTVGQYFDAYRLRDKVLHSDGTAKDDIGPFDLPHKIESWEGCPVDFNMCNFDSSGVHIETIEGLQIESATIVQLTSSSTIISYHNIHKKLHNVSRLFLHPAKDMLGVILIPGLTRVSIMQRGYHRTLSFEQADMLGTMLTKHIKTKDVYALQEEMIDSGFEDFAESV